MPNELLDKLRDIHLPAEPGWWPLAIGWWIIIALLICIIALVFFIQYKKRGAHESNDLPQSNTVCIEYYQQIFENIKKQYEKNNDTSKLIQASSILLRKFCVDRSANTASLTNQDWLLHLDHTFNSQLFTTEFGDILINSNYAPTATIDGKAFIQFIQQCLNTYSGDQQHA